MADTLISSTLLSILATMQSEFCSFFSISKNGWKYVFFCVSSGGQKRRFSFAVAMLQQPPLMILDEPTVGVDPILRAKCVKLTHTHTIANNLIKISETNEHVTIKA